MDEPNVPVVEVRYETRTGDAPLSDDEARANWWDPEWRAAQAKAMRDAIVAGFWWGYDGGLGSYRPELVPFGRRLDRAWAVRRILATKAAYFALVGVVGVLTGAVAGETWWMSLLTGLVLMMFWIGFLHYAAGHRFIPEETDE